MKNILYLLLLFMCIVGVIGSFGYMIYYKQYPIAICQIAVAYALYPTIKDIFKKLVD